MSEVISTVRQIIGREKLHETMTTTRMPRQAYIDGLDFALKAILEAQTALINYEEDSKEGGGG